MATRDVKIDPRKTARRETRPLGDLIVTAYDEVSRDNDDPSDVSRVAANAVMRLLQRARSTSETPKLLLPPRGTSA